MRIRRTLPLTTLLLAVLSTIGSGAPAKKKKSGKNAPNFSYYLLVLSWAPDFCAAPGGTKDPAECGPGRKLGFMVHGFWPQGGQNRGPQNCGKSTVPQAIVSQMLPYIPIASLVQHEWTTHGTCTGLSVADYFAAVRQARDSVTIPTPFQAPAQSVKLSP